MICPDDRLPPKICAPCKWKIFEFHTYKKNVQFAEAEIVKFLGETRPDSINRNNEENDVSSMELDSTQTNRASEHGEHADYMAPVKDENVLEFENPIESAKKESELGRIPEALPKFEEDDCDNLESTEVAPVKDENVLESENLTESAKKGRIPEALPKFEEDDCDDLESTEVICTDDGLPPLICKPCTLKMHEFNTYKMNVHFAKEEIVKFLDEIRPDSDEDCSDRENDETHIEPDSMPSVSVKDEIEIEEWQMPEELKRSMDTQRDGFEPAPHADGNIINIYDESASSKVISQGIEVKQVERELVIDQEEAIQTPGSSDLMNILSLEASEEAVGSSFEGESICTTQDNSIEMRHTNKRKCENDLRDHDVPEEESLSSQISKSIPDVRKSGRSHLKAPLSKRKSGFICDICKRNFTQKHHLSYHVRVHYNDRPFSCNICNKTFKFDNARYRHQLRHLRDEINFGKSEKGCKKNQYNCGICAKNFSTKCVLSKHSNVHSERFKCNSCGKCFSSNYDLRKHIRIHTKEKPFKCEVCFKCFNQKGNLTAHFLIHSSEKPFSCEICDKTFKSKQEKTVHELFHLRKK